MLKRISLVVACLAMLFVTYGARADAWNKRTVITFNQPVELPGVVLPAGTYVFKLVDLPGTRNIVQVFNAGENKLYATILAITDIHLVPHEKPYIGFEERRADLPQAIHEWFYPGYTFGLEFVYPKVRAQEIARQTGKPVLAAEVKPAATPAELEAAPVGKVTPENPEIAIATPPTAPNLAELPPVSTTLTMPETPAVLPETASPVSMIALAGLLCLAGAGTIKVLVR